MEQFIYLIPLLPLIGFAINGLAGNRMPKNVVGALATLMVFIPFVMSCLLFMQLDETHTQFYQNVFNWLHFGNLEINFSFLVDPLSVTMMMVITGIGTLIHLYSIGYMLDDEGFYKFFAYLNLFIFSMLLLVMGSNYVVLFFGWEGVGLCSYLLIGFWYTNAEYGKAARKAFIMNRIGDLGLLVGMFTIYYQFGSFEYSRVFEMASMSGSSDMLTFATLCLFIGAMGKSAQIPLYTWLPDAMAGPTPVSALIHAATMVTAGIYMMVRSNVLFDNSPETGHIVAVIGLCTSLFAAVIGLRQNDIKKVLAYSTVSQLGLMFVAAGLGAYTVAMFHLITHAFFKALLFLGSGSVIHAMGGEQDIRKMGGLKDKIKVTYWVFLIGTLAICGIVPFSGFFSKDAILAEAFAHNPVIWGLAFISSMITAIYMFRLLFVTFFGEFRGTEEQAHHMHESPAIMTVPLGVLAVLSVLGGLLNVPKIFSSVAGNMFTLNLEHFLKPIFKYSASIPAELDHSTEYGLMGLTLGGVILIGFACYTIYVKRASVPKDELQLSGPEKWIANKFYVDEVYDILFVKPVEVIASFFSKVIENKVIDGTVNGIGWTVNAGSDLLRRLQNGNIEYYFMYMTVGIILIFLFKVLF